MIDHQYHAIDTLMEYPTSPCLNNQITKSMSNIPDFSKEEIKAVQDTVKERFHKEIAIHEVDTELRVNPGDRELTECPALYWQVNDCHFIIAKKADENYHCQFFYSVKEQYGTGIDEYHDIVECVTSLLRVQADHELSKDTE